LHVNIENGCDWSEFRVFNSTITMASIFEMSSLIDLVLSKIEGPSQISSRFDYPIGFPSNIEDTLSISWTFTLIPRLFQQFPRESTEHSPALFNPDQILSSLKNSTHAQIPI
jgi:hypothetical protein